MSGGRPKGAAGAARPDAQAIGSAARDRRDFALDLFARLAEGAVGRPGVMRDTYGAGENHGHAVFAAAAEAMGLEVRRDAAANTYATWPGLDRSAPRIVMGSHLDSVPHGGNYDGAAGVVAGLVAIEALRGLGFRPACDLTVMGVRAEESVWFEVSYVGSRAALGVLPAGALDNARIDTGRSLARHIAECGGDAEALRRGERQLDPATLRAFLEVHIEQAPSLVEAGAPVAICAGVPGNFRFPNARIIGRHDHVGTPRRFRRDAGLAAAEFACALDALWVEHEEAGVLVAITFGRFHTDAGKHGMTTVPGLFHFSLDVRALDAGALAAIETRVHAIAAEIEARRCVVFDFGKRASASVGVMDKQMIAALAQSADELGIDAISLGSPASHDAATFAAAGVPTAMLFVRNENGSHNPDERMDIDDFLDACAVLAHWLAGAAG